MSEENVSDSGPPPPPEPPKWLNSEFIEKSLRSEHPDIAVSSVDIKAAVAAGENYACIVFRALANTNHGEIALICKCVPESEFRAKWVRESGIVDTEARMYQTTLPLLRGSLSHPAFPYCYVTEQEDEKELILLKDLRPLGYTTRPRQLGLDAEHCRLALTELAHLHGLSAALRVQEPDVFKSQIQEKYTEKLYSALNRDKFGPFFSSTLQALAEAVKFKLPFRFYSIADIMNKISTTVFDELVNSLELPSEDEIGSKILVLNHGDFWSNNILFKYGENPNEPLACSMIDFQITRIASPAMDLLYFFFTSTEQATRRNHMDELLQLYIDEAQNAMRERGIEPSSAKFYKTVAEVRESMKESSVFGFLSACFVMPLVIAEAKDAPDLDSITEEEFQKMEKNPFLKMYSGPLFCRRFRELLEDFDDMGYFAKYGKQVESVEESINL